MHMVNVRMVNIGNGTLLWLWLKRSLKWRCALKGVVLVAWRFHEKSPRGYANIGRVVMVLYRVDITGKVTNDHLEDLLVTL